MEQTSSRQQWQGNAVTQSQAKIFEGAEMKTRAQVFEELIEKVLGQKCELAPMEEEDGNDVQREGTTQPGTASVPANAGNRQRD